MVWDGEIYWYTRSCDMDQRRKTGSKPKPRLFEWRKFDPSMVRNDGRPSLVEELTTYRDRLPELLEQEGSYVVIKGCESEVFADRESALTFALQRYWPEPALVKKIVAEEPLGSLSGGSL